MYTHGYKVTKPSIGRPWSDTDSSFPSSYQPQGGVSGVPAPLLAGILILCRQPQLMSVHEMNGPAKGRRPCFTEVLPDI